MTVGRDHVGPRPRWPLRRLPRIPDNRIPWTARAPEPGRDLEIAGRAPGVIREAVTSVGSGAPGSISSSRTQRVSGA
uniref:Uncharacterized protein n=1 Tax=Oryza meridionalis TaxID=40149 RepID=A0A0E0EA40_9ORYZ